MSVTAACTQRNSAAARGHGLRRGSVAVLLALLTPLAWAQSSRLPPAPDLSDLLSISNDALQVNPGYRAARADYVAARELVPQAAAMLKPQLSAFVQYDWVNESIDGTFYGVPIDRSTDHSQGRYGARLNQALYRPELLIDKHQAERRLQQAGHVLRDQQDGLLLSVAEAYFGVLAAENNQQFAQAEVEAIERWLQQIRSRVDAGLATESDLAGAIAQQQMALADAVEAEDRVVNSRTTLDALTGQHYRALRPLPDSVQLQAPQPADVQTWIERAKIENPRVREQVMALEIAELEHKRSQRAQWPTLDVVGNAYFLDSGGGSTGRRDEEQERIGVMLNLPIYAGGQLASRKRQTVAQQYRAQANVDSALAELERDVRIAHRKSTAGLLRVRALKRALEAAIVAENAARSGYDAGLVTSADMLTAVQRHYAAARDHAAARYAFIFSSLQLKALAGNLLVADIAKVNHLLMAP